MKNKKTAIIIIFSIIILTSIYYISGFTGIISYLFTTIIYFFLTYFLFIIFKLVKDKSYKILDKNNFFDYLTTFLYKFFLMFIILVVLLGSFSYYQNEIAPAKMPIYTLTNGDKTLVFQSMSHIGSVDFYKKVKENILKYKKQDYVLYFEGVRPGSEKNINKFDEAIGFSFNKDTYKTLSKLYGLTNQDNEELINIYNKNDVNVDISIDEIIEKYEKIKFNKNISLNKNSNNTGVLVSGIKENVKDKNIINKEIIDINKEIEKELSNLNERELNIFRYINRSFINVIIKNESIQENIQQNFANKDLFEVILNERNKFIANKIITSTDKKIISTYGLLHFKGIYNILKENDIKWRISRIDYINALK